jgi:hypothetical protein
MVLGIALQVIVRSCTSCGECGHVTKDCELGKGACRNCGKVGHYIRDCPVRGVAAGLLLVDICRLVFAPLIAELYVSAASA